MDQSRYLQATVDCIFGVLLATPEIPKTSSVQADVLCCNRTLDAILSWANAFCGLGAYKE